MQTKNRDVAQALDKVFVSIQKEWNDGSSEVHFFSKRSF